MNHEPRTTDVNLLVQVRRDHTRMVKRETR